MTSTKPPRFIKRRWRIRYALVADIVVIATAWQISTYFLPPIVVPSLADIGTSLLAIFTDPAQRIHLVYTSLRVLFALVVSFIAGSLLGLLSGSSDHVSDYAKPLYNIMQGVPAVSWIVFSVIWFRDVELRIAFIIIIVTLPAFALQIESGVRNVSLDLVQLAQAFRATRIQRFTMVVLPAITPIIFSAWSINLGNGMRVAVMAELIGATRGVGFQLLNAQSILDMAGAIAWTISLVIVLFAYQAVITIFENRLLKWRPMGEAA